MIYIINIEYFTNNKSQNFEFPILLKYRFKDSSWIFEIIQNYFDLLFPINSNICDFSKYVV